jgi:sodium bicarbonate cotransporter 8/sodium bicarbonate transporter 10
MPARFWVGMWTVLFILIIVIFNLSACVKYITRFTEDSFATLIAIIFIVEAFKKLFEIGTNYPVNYHPGDPIPDICSCNAMCNTNVTEVISGLASGASTNYTCGGTENFTTSNITVKWAGLSESSCGDFGGSWICVPKQYTGDVFFLSCILFAGTFGITVSLISFKSSSLFPNVVSIIHSSNSNKQLLICSVNNTDGLVVIRRFMSCISAIFITQNMFINNKST